MPLVKNRHERIEYLDELLRKYKLTKNEILARYHNKNFNVNDRSLNYDLEYLKKKDMQIHTPNRGDDRYYYLEQTISKGVFNDEDIDIIKQTIQLLRNLKGFRIAAELEEVLRKSKLTKYAVDDEAQSVVFYEDHTESTGTRHLDNLYHAIMDSICLTVTYHPFITNENDKFTFSPYLLKEYRNRWYVIGYHHNKDRIVNLGLDRIVRIQVVNEKFKKISKFDSSAYSENLIGVTIPEGEEPMIIRFKVFPKSAAYVKTKPIIKNQRIIEEPDDGSLIAEIMAFNNYELKQNLLGFGAELKILSPLKLVDEMRFIFERGREKYNEE